MSDYMAASQVWMYILSITALAAALKEEYPEIEKIGRV